MTVKLDSLLHRSYKTGCLLVSISTRCEAPFLVSIRGVQNHGHDLSYLQLMLKFSSVLKFNLSRIFTFPLNVFVTCAVLFSPSKLLAAMLRKIFLEYLVYSHTFGFRQSSFYDYPNTSSFLSIFLFRL